MKQENLMTYIPEELRKTLEENGVTEENLSQRYSDSYVEGPSWTTLSKIANAGNWRSMSTLFKSNISGEPCLEIGLALLSKEIQTHKRV
jgi:hypothetical protein